jgi:hypothetical protein
MDVSRDRAVLGKDFDVEALSGQELIAQVKLARQIVSEKLPVQQLFRVRPKPPKSPRGK